MAWRPVVGAALLATTTALAVDALDDALVHRAVTRDAARLATSHPAVAAALAGPPVTVGSLWATTVAAPYKSPLARATFDVGGPGGVRSEVSVLASRNGRGGPPLVGRWSAAGWTVVDVRAALPGAVAGPVRGVSLMPPPPPAAAVKKGDAAAGKVSSV